MIRPGTLWLAVLALGLLAAPAATAQGVLPSTLTVGPASVEPLPLVPEEPATLLVPWRYEFANQAAAASAAMQDIHIQWTPTCADGNLTLEGPRTTVATPNGVEAHREGTVEFTVRATRSAPGLTPLACTIEALASSPNGAVGEAAAQTAVDLTVGYFGLLRVNVPATIRQVEPGGDARFLVELTNLGNAPSRVLFAAEGSLHGYKVTFPDVRLGTSETERTAQAELTVRRPASGVFANEQATLAFTITPQSEGGEDGEPVHLSVLVRERGWTTVGAVGGSATLALALAAVGFLVLRRRKRQTP